MASILLLIPAFLSLVSLFVPLISLQSIYAQNNTNGKATSSDENRKINLVLNPNFNLLDKVTKQPTNWNDTKNVCKSFFKCKTSNDGWDDKVSFELSTINSTNKRWSWIYGNEIGVKPNEKYLLTTHMKLNTLATGSHVVLDAYNTTSKQWYQIIQCPGGSNGPLEWKEFSCKISIPANTTKIRPVLNAGWSSLANSNAETSFDAIELVRSSLLTGNQ